MAYSIKILSAMALFIFRFHKHPYILKDVSMYLAPLLHGAFDIF